MSKESLSDNEKRRFGLVHKPFSLGQINLFNPPKKNLNGHIASAKLLPKDKINNVVDDALELSIESNKFCTPWKISAVFLVVISNLTAATVIFINKQNQLTVATELNKQSYTSGQTNLAEQEFVELNLNNLKNINPVTEKTDQKIQEDEEKIPTNMPLAIPPTNLPQDIKIPQVKEDKQYYYILSEYTGERSLELAKTKVPNVSLINFPQGIFIYMGAFTQKEVARQFVEQLKKIGLNGYVYPFE